MKPSRESALKMPITKDSPFKKDESTALAAGVNIDSEDKIVCLIHSHGCCSFVMHSAQCIPLLINTVEKEFATVVHEVVVCRPVMSMRRNGVLKKIY